MKADLDETGLDISPEVSAPAYGGSALNFQQENTTLYRSKSVMECKRSLLHFLFFKQGGMPELGGFWRDIWGIFGGHLGDIWMKFGGQL